MNKVIITGATGMVGKGVLLECLDSDKVSEVLCIGRNPVQLEHPKLKQVIHKDFSEFESISDQIQGYDAAFMCMGVSAAGLNEKKYNHMTYDYTMALANALIQPNSQMTVCYVSGQGTDSTEKGRQMWARVKGKTENGLLKLGFKGAYMFRPGAIIPLRGIKSSTRLYQFFYDYFLWLLKLVKRLAPNSVVNTTDIGLAMINCATVGYSEKILKPADILKAAQA